MILLILLCAFIWLIVHQFYWKRRNLPPGPMPFPLIGNMTELIKHEPGYGAFENWKKQYGPIFTFWLGQQPIVAFTDYETIKEAFVKNGDVFIDKPSFEILNDHYRGGDYGVIDTNGDSWRSHRRFALHQLREFGLGKNAMEEKISIEIEELTKSLQSSGPVIPSIQNVLDIAVGSIINQLLFGYRFDENRIDEVLNMKRLVAEQMRWFAEPSFGMINFYPLLRFVPYFSGIYAEVFRGRDELFGLIEKQIDVRRKEVAAKSPDEEVTDYVEAFLREQEKRQAEGDNESFCDLQLINMCWDLWVAGLDTTSNTLTWFILFLLHNPEVQDKIHEELDEVIRSDRVITMSDKPNLPYMNAVINETQRLGNIVPVNLIHITTKDYTINGLTIEKGTAAVAQVSTVHYDEEVFPEPMKFKPERFLDDNGKLKKVDELNPFSIGKRQCLGEGLARMELFMFAANLVNRFNIQPHLDVPSLKKVFGTTMAPQASHCRMLYRF